jgi:hypothetical protein
MIRTTALLALVPMALMTSPTTETLNASPLTSVPIPEAPKNFQVDYIIDYTSKNIIWSLSVKGIDTSKWSTTKTGLYLGIGFGNNQMMSTDYVGCAYVYTGASTDAFACMDGYFDSMRVPITNEATQDISAVNTP